MSQEPWNWLLEDVHLVAGVQPPGFAPVTKQALSKIVWRIVNWTSWSRHQLTTLPTLAYTSPLAATPKEYTLVLWSSKLLQVT